MSDDLKWRYAENQMYRFKGNKHSIHYRTDLSRDPPCARDNQSQRLFGFSGYSLLGCWALRFSLQKPIMSLITNSSWKLRIVFARWVLLVFVTNMSLAPQSGSFCASQQSCVSGLDDESYVSLSAASRFLLFLQVM